MRVDFTALFRTLADWTGRPAERSGRLTGETLLAMMRALVRFDEMVIFAYRDEARPIDLFSTFDADGYNVFVTLYQAGPYLLDPFYHTARAGRAGIFRMRELAPDRFFSSEYYRTYYSKTRLAEEIGFFAPAADGVTVVVSLMRREKAGVSRPRNLRCLPMRRRSSPLSCAANGATLPGALRSGRGAAGAASR